MLFDDVSTKMYSYNSVMSAHTRVCMTHATQPFDNSHSSVQSPSAKL